MRLWRVAALLGAVAALSSCARLGRYAEKRADAAAYANIRGARQAGLGEAGTFSIGKTDDPLLQELLAVDARREEAEILSLADTLAIAMANSRAYQSRKESLFLTALYLTETQKDFNFNYTASANASTEMTSFRDGTATESFGDHGVDGGLAAGVSRTLATGARVSLGYSRNLLAYFTNPDTSSDSGALSLNVWQPLLNGVGPLVTKEPLRQAERDMVYETRDFKRYQQEFVIDIATMYYETLQTRDEMVNAKAKYESAVANRERNDALAKAGDIPDFQAAQTRLSELSAADSWTLARASYAAALDDFRFTLGLPIDLNVAPDPEELSVLAARGLVELDITLQAALESAVSNRLDLVNQRMAVEDRARKVEIARRDFLPDLDVGYQVSAREGGAEKGAQQLSVELNLPFDWTQKRNAFRVARIKLAQEIRALEEDEDDVRRNVRDLWRKLERNRSVYNNRLLSVKLSERTVEETALRLKQGKALTRDLIDAEDDLTDAKNDATSALVDFTINRMKFWNAIERFEIDPKGMWYELDAEKPVETP